MALDDGGNDTGDNDLGFIMEDPSDLDTPLPNDDGDDDNSVMGLQPMQVSGHQASDQIHALLDENMEHDDSATGALQFKMPEFSKQSKFPIGSRDVTIKQEIPRFKALPGKFVPDSIVDLSDDEETHIKTEGMDEEPFAWTSLPDEIIDLRGEDESHIKAEGEGEEPFLWTSIPEDIIKLSSDSDSGSIVELDNAGQGTALFPKPGMAFLSSKKPNERPQRNYQAVKKTLHDQRTLMESFPGRLPQDNSAGPSRLPAHRLLGPEMGIDDLNDTTWMSSNVNFDEEAAAKFKALKQSYQAKQRADLNTVEDDYQFQRAVKEEKSRRKRLEQEYFASCGDFDVENDIQSDNRSDGKDSDFDDDDNDEKSDEEGLFVTQDPRTKKSAKAAKKRKLNPPRVETLQDVEHDLEFNLMAGIDNYFRAQREECIEKKSKSKKNSGKPEKTKKVDKGKAKSKGKKDWARKDKAPSKKRPTQAGYLNNSGSLLTYNVFEAGKAHRDLAPLPGMTGTNKSKALAALISNMPIGDRRDLQMEKEQIKRASIVLGKRKVNPAADGYWKFTGMDTTLRHHQVQGAAFMRERELADEQPLGGILADAMGLGKTVMAVALMVANRPTRVDNSKSTLIVCTPALLNQWEKEIYKHVSDGVFGRVTRHHSGSHVVGKGAVIELERADVVLTTYQEVMKSYPKMDIPKEVVDFDQLRLWWQTIWSEDRDLLHKARFYRVILDESQAIKNHLSQTSIACRALMAKHRWCLSGTPIMNRVEELYPYFKFLRVECTGSFAEFMRHFCIEGSTDCNKRLHCILDQIMIRRTMDDLVLGRPIVSLPEKCTTIERLDFNKVERLIYKIISRRYIRAINKASAKGELERRPGYGVVLFLRLRQLSAHIFLIQEILQDMFDMDSVDRLEKAAIDGSDSCKPARDLLHALRRMVAAKGQHIEATPDSQSAESDSERCSGLAHKFGQRLKTLKEAGRLAELRDEQLCHKCKGIPEDPLVTSCLHVYCKECLNFLAYEAAKKDLDNTPCRECGTPFTETQSCSGLKELALDDFSDLSTDLKSRKSKNGKVNMHWVAYDDELVMSAKTLGVEAQIRKWLEEDPDKKIIIFSQFLMIMSILERLCQKNEWEYCAYNGKMSHIARDKAIESFGRKDSKIRVMIASLKCGGIGLNLTMASKVACVDLWFNSCVEQQAFSRVWRMGQDQETFVTRFIVNDSVDDRLEQMQKRKEKIVGAAIDDRSITSNLSVQEVMRLFGDVHIDKRSKKPFIALDEDELLDSILKPSDDDERDAAARKK